MARKRVVQVRYPQTIGETHSNIQLRFEDGTEMGWGLPSAQFAAVMQLISFAKANGVPLFYIDEEMTLKAEGDVNL